MWLDAATVWTEDVGAVEKETLADEGHVALGTDETVAVPMSVLERDELGAAETYGEIKSSPQC